MLACLVLVLTQSPVESTFAYAAPVEAGLLCSQAGTSAGRATTCSCALQVLAFPVTLLISFWQNHHLLDVVQRPVWRVVSGRSREYAKRILAGAKLACSTRHICTLLCSPLSGSLAGAGSSSLTSL